MRRFLIFSCTYQVIYTRAAQHDSCIVTLGNALQTTRQSGLLRCVCVCVCVCDWDLLTHNWGRPGSGDEEVPCALFCWLSKQQRGQSEWERPREVISWCDRRQIHWCCDSEQALRAKSFAYWRGREFLMFTCIESSMQRWRQYPHIIL